MMCATAKKFRLVNYCWKWASLLLSVTLENLLSKPDFYLRCERSCDQLWKIIAVCGERQLRLLLYVHCWGPPLFPVITHSLVGSSVPLSPSLLPLPHLSLSLEPSGRLTQSSWGASSGWVISGCSVWFRMRLAFILFVRHVRMLAAAPWLNGHLVSNASSWMSQSWSGLADWLTDWLADCIVRVSNVLSPPARLSRAVVVTRRVRSVLLRRKAAPSSSAAPGCMMALYLHGVCALPMPSWEAKLQDGGGVQHSGSTTSDARLAPGQIRCKGKQCLIWQEREVSSYSRTASLVDWV